MLKFYITFLRLIYAERSFESFKDIEKCLLINKIPTKNICSILTCKIQWIKSDSEAVTQRVKCDLLYCDYHIIYVWQHDNIAKWRATCRALCLASLETDTFLELEICNMQCFHCSYEFIKTYYVYVFVLLSQCNMPL